MNKEITLHTIPCAPPGALEELLDEFESRSHIHVNAVVIEWEKERSEVVNLALRRQEGDVLLVGTPITSDLIGMNALRQYTTREIGSLGGASSYLASRWQSGIGAGGDQVWAVPWMLDIRVIYYWRDLLAQAGVDEADAFQDYPHMLAALQCLKSAGIASGQPWVVNNVRYNTLHAVSSFIWEQGGDLFAPGGRKVTFHEAPALQGMCNYFSFQQDGLGRAVPDEDALFRQRRAAATIMNGWAMTGEIPPGMGIAPVPGGSYVGGTDLMIWNHSRSAEAAFQLVSFLAQADVQWRTGGQFGWLPPHLSELTSGVVMAHPIRGALARAALTGRTFPCVSMIGMVEDRLSTALSLIQTRLQDDPAAEMDDLLQTFVIPLGRRMNVAFTG
jgi:multiple sugar transport system substrate-binding protein